MIKIVKLISGEELVGEISFSNTDVTVKKPCALQMMPSRQDPTQPVMSLIPYAFYTEDHSVKVSQDKIIWMESPVKELYNQYNQIFGSGIQLAGV